MEKQSKKILWGHVAGGKCWEEEILSTNEANFEKAKFWALTNGFDSFRIQILDDKEPCFTKTINF